MGFQQAKRIAIVGGGPSGLFLYKTLIDSGQQRFSVDIFEAKPELGVGMPYSSEGANAEHVTNVSGNEIPHLVSSVTDWIKTLADDTLLKYEMERDHFTPYMVLPRLLFGEYLNAQIKLLLKKGKDAGLVTRVHLNTHVNDVVDDPEKNTVSIKITEHESQEFDHVIICTGHKWPLQYEGKVPGYFDSPYPPAKLKIKVDHCVAIRGSSLTAIDAIRTLARQHGTFIREAAHVLSYHAHAHAGSFKIAMHSRHGLLPGIRFHLADPHLSKNSLLSDEQIADHVNSNGGFLSLDFIFEKDFKEPLKTKDAHFYELIKDMNMEEFVQSMMDLRENADPFVLFKTEYAEAATSIRNKKSVYWKEMLAILSFAMNYPAKHFSAEDMMRLQKVLMPLISIVIAFVPQSSCEELIALHDAGRLEIFSVGDDSHVDVHHEGGITYHHTDDEGKSYATRYKTYIDCIGQRHLSLPDFPFKSLVQRGTLSAARLQFTSAAGAKLLYEMKAANIDRDDNEQFYLQVPGVAITDSFEVRGRDGKPNPRVYMMAVPFIAGYNPDYSGLDFCEEASKRIVAALFSKVK